MFLVNQVVLDVKKIFPRKSVFFLFIASLIFSQAAYSDFFSKTTKYDFLIGKNRGFIYLPTKDTAKQKMPWIWYAPHMEGTPSRNDFILWEKLSNAGLAIAAVDNGDGRGDKRSVDVFNEFYKVLVDLDTRCNLHTYVVKSIEEINRNAFSYPALLKDKEGNYYYLEKPRSSALRIKKDGKQFQSELLKTPFFGDAQKILLYGNSCKILKSNIIDKTSTVDTHLLLQKPCLLGGSRGGYMLYSWAIINPEKISCIGGIYPVLDLRVWPGIDEMSRTLNLSREEFARTYAKNTLISKIHVLAKHSIPILHIHGSDDTTVSYDSERQFVAEYLKSGGEISLITSFDNGHDSSMDYFSSNELADFFIYHSNKELMKN